MNTTTYAGFEEVLQEKKSRVLYNAAQTLESGMVIDSADLPDEIDLATNEFLQSFQFRLRGRERTFLQKIETALTKIQNGTYGICEECEEPIQIKRLQVRPEARLCIQCKEEEEQEERQYNK